MGGGNVKAANSWEVPNAVVAIAGSADVTSDGLVRVAIPAPGLVVVRVVLAE
jgi:hypothetical protein